MKTEEKTREWLKIKEIVRRDGAWIYSGENFINKRNIINIVVNDDCKRIATVCTSDNYGFHCYYNDIKKYLDED